METLTGLSRIANAAPITKEADLAEFIERVGGATGDAGKRIGDWYQGINPEARSALLRGMGGAAVGGLAAGGMSALTPRDEDAPSPVLRNALMGALMGGGAAAALPAGLKMLGGQTRFSGEPKPGIMGRGFNLFAKPFEKAPLTTAGGVAGGVATLSQLKPIRLAMEMARNSGSAPIAVAPRPFNLGSGNIKDQLSRMKGAIGDRAHNIGAKLVRTRPGAAARTWRGAFGKMDDAVNILHRARVAASGAQPASMAGMGLRGRAGKLGLAAIPIGLLVGALADSYAKGRVK
jgi:hypothetical protein